LSDDRDLKHALIELLAHAGLTASLIPEGPTRSADIRAVHPSGEAYLLEVKSRVTSWIDEAQPTAPVDGSPVLLRTDPTGVSNALSRVFEKAASQLQPPDLTDNTLRLVWFFAHPSDLHFHYTRIANTAYGATNVAAPGRPVLLGFYVHHAAFARWRHLDGVLLGPFGALLLNDLSPRYDALKSSALAACSEFVTDPRELASTDQCYYLDPTERGTDPSTSKARLVDKYGLSNIQFVDLTRFGAAVASPSKDTASE